MKATTDAIRSRNSQNGAAPRAASAGAAPVADVYDLLEPEDILAKLNKSKPTFFELAASEKWKGAPLYQLGSAASLLD
jgi:hypothetical protein